MSYCSVSDVQSDFKSIVFASGQLITDTAVTQFIVEAGALIDSYVGARYVTPITANASSVALMSLYCRTLVAARIRGILENKQATNIDANQNVKADGFGVNDVMRSLREIKNNESVLSGASLILTSAGFYSNNDATGVTPKFHKNRKQW